MASVVVNGDTSGAVTLSAPAVAGTVTVTLPSTSGTMAVGGGTITTLTTTSDITVQGLTVGRGAGAVSTNTAVGASALAANTTGSQNNSFGLQSSISNTTGNYNNAFGVNALRYNTTGSSNTAYGDSALTSNTTASNNTAVGYQAGFTNTTGTSSSYVGRQAGYSSNANYCTMMGDQAGYSSTGVGNTFFGYYAGNGVTSGTNNSFLGYGAGYLVTTGAKNTIIGAYNGNQGGLDIRTASNYIVLSDGDGNPRLWYNGATNYVYAPAVYSQSAALSANVGVDSQGALYRATSSLKYKTEVSNATHGLADVLKLRSVTYKGKNKTVDKQTVFGGLIAEEVHEAGLTEFVQYADDGTPDALAYGNMVALAFKAIQELKAIVDAQAVEIAALKGTA